ncbi:MAG: lytic murein transglycosylase B [Gammaproteobacteria bacterium]
MRHFHLIILALVLTLQTSSGFAKSYYAREDVKNFVQYMIDEHGFERTQLKLLFKGVKQQESVLEAIATPAERKKKWFEYRPIFLKQARADAGVKFWRENQTILEQAEEIYGVPPEIIVAIIGVETYYGRITGKHPVFDSLVTLGFGYPKRAKFFLSELEHYLLMCREEGFDPSALKGSYAGAMGVGQFISSSYRRYSVDQNEDGKRDLWNSKEDIIGSVANYFKVHGWKKNQAVASSAQFSGNAKKIDDSNTLKPAFTYGQLIKQGFEADMPIANDEKVSLFVLDTSKNTKEYWIGQHNFYVITRYNHSHMYAMAVHQLSQEIKKQWILTAQSAN